MTKRRSFEIAAVLASALVPLAMTMCAPKSDTGSSANGNDIEGGSNGDGGIGEAAIGDAGVETDASIMKSHPGPPPASLGTPPVHRASADACTVPRAHRTLPEAGPTPNPFGMCKTDDECTTGASGRCDNVYNSQACACDYDQCTDDSACNGAVCACRTSDATLAPNRCLHKGDCTTDADCGPGSYCSPSRIAGDLCDVNNLAYYCHTPDDECVQDSQCPSKTLAPGGPCLFTTDVKRWVCYDGPEFGCDAGISPLCGGT